MISTARRKTKRSNSTDVLPLSMCKYEENLGNRQVRTWKHLRDWRDKNTQPNFKQDILLPLHRPQYWWVATIMPPRGIDTTDSWGSTIWYQYLFVWRLKSILGEGIWGTYNCASQETSLPSCALFGRVLGVWDSWEGTGVKWFKINFLRVRMRFFILLRLARNREETVCVRVMSWGIVS